MRRFFIIAGSLCFLLSVFFLTLTPQVLGQDGETLLKEVQAALETQDYPRTISLADKALAALPGSSEAFRMRGNAYPGLKDLQKALSDYDRAVQLDNRSYRAFAGRALVRLMMKEHDKALQDADKALALKVDYGAGYSISAIWPFIRNCKRPWKRPITTRWPPSSRSRPLPATTPWTWCI
jgi:tetratricopeptide (TPR) repeat protein